LAQRLIAADGRKGRTLLRDTYRLQPGHNKMSAVQFDDDCPATLYCTVLSAPLRREFASLAAPLSRDGLFV
jgi:hypothetical protein